MSRQPRAGNSANAAQSVTSSGQHWVQLKNSSGAWNNAIRVTTAARATTIASRLNNQVFNEPEADLDFITPSYDPESNQYIVVWSGVKWSSSFATTTSTGYTTQERLYTGCNIAWSSGSQNNSAYKAKSFVVTIATVTAADVTLLGKPEWEIAFMWANKIREYVNGWNCTKDSTGGAPLIASGYIPQLAGTNQNYSGTTTAYNGTYYGVGEAQPNFTMANNDIFHTCDLIVARPNNSSTSVWTLNKWIKLTYNEKSVVARIADTCGTSSLDLSGGGTAYALGFISGNITVSAP
jgi:hypothetical protein